MSLAETTVLLGLHSLGMILLFFHHVVISLLALGACQGNFLRASRYLRLLFFNIDSGFLHTKKRPKSLSCYVMITYFLSRVNMFGLIFYLKIKSGLRLQHKLCTPFPDGNPDHADVIFLLFRLPPSSCHPLSTPRGVQIQRNLPLLVRVMDYDKSLLLRQEAAIGQHALFRRKRKQ